MSGRAPRRKGDRVERLFLLTPRIASTESRGPTRMQAVAEQQPLSLEALSGKRQKKRRQ